MQTNHWSPKDANTNPAHLYLTSVSYYNSSSLVHQPLLIGEMSDEQISASINWHILVVDTK